MNGNKILITGGGTGGHLIPGVALYEEFHERGIGAALLIGKKDSGSTALRDVSNDDIFIYSAKTLSWNIFKLLQFSLSFILSFLKAMIIIKRDKFNAVIGMGGYVSAPGLLAAKIMKLPVFLCEQNTVPGKVTSLFAGTAQKIFTTFEESKKYFKPENGAKAVNLGNPIRKNVLTAASREASKAHFNMRHCRKIILVIGGSQGALQINELFLKIKKMFPEDLKDFGVIWSTGAYSYKRFVKELQDIEWNGSVFLSPYIDNVGMTYRASDVAISRSGAGVIMELAAAGIPSILIPYPYAADNHQETNAEVFHAAGASIKISGNEATPENVGRKLISILNNTGLHARMSERALSISRINASGDIVKAVAEAISFENESGGI